MVIGDKILICRECDNQFRFAESEREFYQQKGFSEPLKCPECRKTKQDMALSITCSKCGSETDLP